ncbi:MAG: acetylornithine carbamoyltransferase [Taibaiella sp.]|nr:acetylornithine carbamoyltransferase [Taibaiella sp.]
MKNFTSVHDVTDIDALVQTALACKKEPFANKYAGVNKRVGLLFMNPSMRTRISTQLAAKNLGMDTIVFNIDKDGWKLELEDGAVMNGTTVEHIKDAAPVLNAYFDILCVRTFPALIDRAEDYSEVLLNQLIKHTNIPIVSLESTTLHPLQSLADIITITETFKEDRKPKIVLTWAPHIKPIPQCVANSFAQWVNAWGKADFVVTHPEGYELKEEFTKNATIEYDQHKALHDADFVYVKNWSSYKDYGKILTDGAGWMLTPGHLSATNNAKVMHCLPVRRNVELSDKVLDSVHSIVTQQATNRVCAAQAVLSEILNSN